jgi:hypothetical protein
LIAPLAGHIQRFGTAEERSVIERANVPRLVPGNVFAMSLNPDRESVRAGC